QGSLGLGEAYMDGWWDAQKIDELIYKILSADLDRRFIASWQAVYKIASNYLLNAGRKSQAFEVGEWHYDIGNDLYRAMLGKRLAYTCGYWKEASDLDAAQEAKLDLVCRKIGLKSGQRVLDIGSGWGSFTGYAAEKYGASALGVTVSKEQKNFTDEFYKNLPIETQLQDYREISGKFDHVVSLGMFEHVGYKNYRTFMEVAHRALKDEGLILLHTIGGNRSVHGTDAWIDKYIFPNSMIPSIQQISRAVEGLFVVEDWHNFGADYDKTLMAWHRNFEASWDNLKINYSERFHRMWRYYLLACAGSFRARNNQLWQIILSKRGVLGGYQSIR
ncbi:MAG: cyclopropane fatty acyl phospholipid synthase, partial [bacterium]